MNKELETITKSVLSNHPNYYGNPYYNNSYYNNSYYSNPYSSQSYYEGPIEARRRSKARAALGASAAIAGGTGIGLGIYSRRNPYAVPIAANAIGNAASKAKTAIVNADERVGRTLASTGKRIGSWAADAGQDFGIAANEFGGRIGDDGFFRASRDLGSQVGDKIRNAASSGTHKVRMKTGNILSRAARFVAGKKL